MDNCGKADLRAITSEALTLLKNDRSAAGVSRALALYRQAAEANYGPALYNLGSMYFNGIGVERDYNEALKWFYKAAEQGDIDAMFNIGYIAYRGYLGSHDLA